MDKQAQHTPGPVKSALTLEQALKMASGSWPSSWDADPSDAAFVIAQELRRVDSVNAELLAACMSVAGVFQDVEDAPIFARKCIAAIAKARP